MGGRALDDRLQLEARRINELLTLASEEAVQKGMELGFLQTPAGYTFLVLDPAGTWLPPAEPGPLRSRELEEPLYLELRVEGHPVPPADTRQKDLVPQVLLLSSGEATQFELAVRARGHGSYFRITGDVLGRITMERMEVQS